MKSFAKRLIFISAFFAAICFAPICRAEVAALTTTQQIESLRLPSFSIFGFDEIDDPKLNAQMPEEELQKLLIAYRKLGKTRASYDQTNGADASFAIPLVMFRSRRLFTQSSWSTQDIEEGQRISRFFARLVDRPELEIHSSNNAAFRDGLVHIRNWYANLCRQNTTLAAMIFTFDDGPYYGFALPQKRFSSLRVLQTMKIPGREEKFALMTDGKTAEPFFIGVLTQGGAIRWATRFSKSSGGIIDYAELGSGSCDIIQNYGYQCYAFAGEVSSIYLDENLNLRFYFVSW